MKKAMMYISICTIGFAVEFNLHDQIKIEYEKFQKKNKQDGKTPHQKCVAFIQSLMEENDVNAEKIGEILKGKVFPITHDKHGAQKIELTKLLQKHFEKYSEQYSNMISKLDVKQSHQAAIKKIYNESQNQKANQENTVNDSNIIGAGVTLIAEGPDKKIYFLLAKQNNTFNGQLTNFGGLKDSGETPEVAASKELEEESCGAYKISPEELRQCAYVDSESFRTYYAKVEHTNTPHMIQSAYDLSKNIKYKRSEYIGFKPSYEDNLAQYTLKRFHDYLENAGYTWVEFEKLKSSCQSNNPQIESELETYGVDLESLENKNANLSFETETSILRKEFAKSTDVFFKSGKLEQVLKQKIYKKEKTPVSKESLQQKFAQEFYALPNQWKSFMDHMANNHKVIVQATGKAYRNGDYFKGREEDARYLFGKKTPCGALFQLIKDKKINVNEVVFLFDIDNTMIKDLNGLKIKRGTKAKHYNSTIETAKDTDEILQHLQNSKIPFGFLTFRDKTNGVQKTEEDFNQAGIKSYVSKEFTNLKIEGAQKNIIFTDNKVKSFGIDKVLQQKNIKYIVMIDDSQAALREIKDSVEKGEATDLYTKTSVNKTIDIQKPDWLNRIHTNSNGKKIILVNYAKEKEPYSNSIGVETNQNNTAYFDRDQNQAFVLVQGNSKPKNYVTTETKNLLKEQEEKKNTFFTINTNPLNAQELPDEIEINDLKNIQISSGGSNASFTGEINGKTYRVKMAQAYNAYNERLAAKLYKLAGCRVMDFTLVKIPKDTIQVKQKNDGTITIDNKKLTIKNFAFFTHSNDKTAFAASLNINNLIDMRRFNSSTDIKNLNEFVKNKIATLSDPDRKEIFENFVIDAWLGNYDVIGTPGGGSAINIGFLKNGDTYQPIRFDNGAALQSRAQGGKKGNGFNDQAKEFEFLLGVQCANVKNVLGLQYHAIIAQASKAFFQHMTQAEFEAGQNKLKAITDEQIRQTVEKYGYEPAKDEQDLKPKNELANILINRKNVILSKRWDDVQKCLTNKQ